MFKLLTLAYHSCLVSSPTSGGGTSGGVRLRITEHGPTGGPSEQHEKQQQRGGAAAGLFHGGGSEFGAVRGDPGSGGQHDLLQSRVRQKLRRHSRQALRQDGAVHGGGDQIQIAAPQHAAGERELLSCSLY